MFSRSTACYMGPCSSLFRKRIATVEEVWKVTNRCDRISSVLWLKEHNGPSGKSDSMSRPERMRNWLEQNWCRTFENERAYIRSARGQTPDVRIWNIQETRAYMSVAIAELMEKEQVLQWSVRTSNSKKRSAALICTDALCDNWKFNCIFQHGWE